MSSYWVQLQTKDTAVRKVFGLSDSDAGCPGIHFNPGRQAYERQSCRSVEKGMTTDSLSESLF